MHADQSEGVEGFERNLDSAGGLSTKQNGRFVILLLIAFFGVLLLRTAWICDDAYITLRTVHHFTNGYGLRWNIAERVQVYTHPLWMFLVSGVYFFTQEAFYSTLSLSVFVSLAAVAAFCFARRETGWAVVLGLLILCFSKAFVEYSTSGLENPLSHLLLAFFLFVYLDFKFSERRLLLLTLLAALVILNRMDLGLLVLPPLVWCFWRVRSRKALLYAFLGMLPVFAWECFSVIYYGFPFPNTAYAKLATDIPPGELALQGLFYLLDSLARDPLTLLCIGWGVLIPVLQKKWRQLPVAIGVLLYLGYVVKIGGDFMSGRFLTASLFCAAFLISRGPFQNFPTALMALLMVTLVALCGPHPIMLTGFGYEDAVDSASKKGPAGIADERAFYYRNTGLLNRDRESGFKGTAAEATWTDRYNQETVLVKSAIGFYGYIAGPGKHIVEPWALPDPLLARLPAIYTSNWRIGHFSRFIPAGYIDTLKTGKNVIKDESLATYYDRIQLITRGPLFSSARWRAICTMNAGRYQRLINRLKYRSPKATRVKLQRVSKRVARGASSDASGTVQFSKQGLIVELGRKYHHRVIEIGLDSDDCYHVVFWSRGAPVATVKLPPQIQPGGGLYCHTLTVPRKAVRREYDTIHIIPRPGPVEMPKDTFFAGHVLLSD